MSSRDGAVVRALASHQCGPGSIAAQCHVWVEFVVAFRLFSRVFIWALRFSSPCKKPQFKLQFDQLDCRRTVWKPAKANAASSLNILYNLFLFFFYFRCLTACLCVYFKNTNSELLSALQNYTKVKLVSIIFQVLTIIIQQELSLWWCSRFARLS